MNQLNKNFNVFEHMQSEAQHTATYDLSVQQNEFFWQQQALQRLDWEKEFTVTKDVSFDKDDLHIRWYEDGLLNVCYNCVDRHLEKDADKTAIIFEKNEPGQAEKISFRKLHQEVCKLANYMQSMGLVTGDRVVLYMPMVPEAAYAMLACARLGIIHSVVFGGFSAAALANRIDDSEARLVITADESRRGAKTIELKARVDEALSLAKIKCVEKVMVVKNTGCDTAWNEEIDIDYRSTVDAQSDVHQCEFFSAEHPLFILYTSGSTGKPKGLQHSSGGYLTYAATTFYYVFQYQQDDVFWSSADVGWITGHTYLIYGPLVNGATTIIYEGVPNYPTLGRMGEVIDEHKVSLFLTAPTTIRTWITDTQCTLGSSTRKSLRVMNTVGEPINPEVWKWYHEEFGLGQATVIDSWWQTETGGMMITPMPNTLALKPGSATKPMFGIQVDLVNEHGEVLEGAVDGHLVVNDSWPGQARTIWRDHDRFIQTYFTTYPGRYFSGDGATRDEDNYLWITGRVDDVINVSGHRMGTAEVESAVVLHPQVAEAAVVGYPHDIKGQGIYVYVVLINDIAATDDLKKEITNLVRKEVGPVGSPDIIQWSADLPKTRSGKIMRRILRKIAANELDSFGDISTMADESVLQDLIANR